MNKQSKLLNIYSTKTRETQSFTFNQFLQLRDGIEIIKNQNHFLSSKMQALLKNLDQKVSLNQISAKKYFLINKLSALSIFLPSHVIQEVWKRDKGKCVICNSPNNLLYAHYLPYSKRGISITTDNIRILCSRHNLAKSNKIE